MRIKILILMGLFCLSTSIFGQEIGSVIIGNHSVKLLKSNDLFACVYSDLNSTSKDIHHKTFNFPIKETIYQIIMDGFKTNSSRQIFVKTDEYTIVKFDYKIIDGQLKLAINHNDLYTQLIGVSTYLTQKQVKSLFGITTNFG
jgi:hypothetical protein|tara:strand:+ start:182 stop:610 length:429 start_codon:yes stop_codon:yes gene_type:complete